MLFVSNLLWDFVHRTIVLRMMAITPAVNVVCNGNDADASGVVIVYTGGCRSVDIQDMFLQMPLQLCIEGEYLFTLTAFVRHLSGV